MEKNTNKNLTDMLSKIDPKTLKQGISSLNALLGSKDGEKLKQQLGSLDKDQLMGALHQMDANAIKEKLSGIDLSKLDLDSIAKNPDVKKISDLMKNQQNK